MSVVLVKNMYLFPSNFSGFVIGFEFDWIGNCDGRVGGKKIREKVVELRGKRYRIACAKVLRLSILFLRF